MSPRSRPAARLSLLCPSRLLVLRTLTHEIPIVRISVLTVPSVAQGRPGRNLCGIPSGHGSWSVGYTPRVAPGLDEHGGPSRRQCGQTNSTSWMRTESGHGVGCLPDVHFLRGVLTTPLVKTRCRFWS